MADDRKQMNVRLPDEEMLARIDARATAAGDSRNAWVVRALAWVLDQPVTTRTKREQI
jgi:predicted HicB family RNase H-like nuclease